MSFVEPYRALKAGLCALLLSCFWVSIARAQAGPAWRVGAVPAWVQHVDAPAITRPSAPSEGGLQIGLLDRQVRVGASHTDSFSHVSQRIINEVGLQQSSQLRIDFDASYQTLTLHFIRVVRGGQQLNALDPRAIKVIQREPELEHQVYTGLQTAVLFLNDLRVGDVVDYAYTLSGSDPTLNQKYAGEFWLGASAPIDRVFARLTLPVARPVQLSFQGPAHDDASLQPSHEVHGTSAEYRWDLSGVRSYSFDGDAPKWFEQLPSVRFSEFGSWNEVASWGAALFAAPPSSGPGVSDWAARTRREVSAPGDYILRATRFTQDEIRYVGIEVGMGRRMPASPSTVLTRRYGDCKDKAALLIALLRADDIPAQPLLVSSSGGPAMDTSVASPALFDHVIVRVAFGDSEYFIDPTVTLQGGRLGRMRYSPFDRGLILDANSRGLVTLQREPAEAPLLMVRDTLEVPTPESGAETKLETVRTYQGEMADELRATFRAQSPEKMGKGYLGLYNEQYAGIREASPLEHEDDRLNNLFVVRGHFAIPKPWAWDARAREYSTNFYAFSIDFGLVRPASTTRTSPLNIPFPYRGQYDLSVNLPFELKGDFKPTNLEGPSFSFHFDTQSFGRKLTYHYDVTTSAAAVDAHSVALQGELAARARALMARKVRYSGAASGGGAPLSNESANWPMVALTAAWLAACAWAAWGMYWLRRSIANTRLSRGPPRPIGGWLYVVALNVFLGPPLILTRSLPSFKWVFSLARWHLLTTPGLTSYRPGLAAVLVFEVGYQLAVFCYSLTVLVTFIKKRRSFPWHFSALLLALLITGASDCVLTAIVSPAHQITDSVLGVARTLIAAAIWISYLHRSKRVAATFTTKARRRRRRGPRIALEDAEG